MKYIDFRLYFAGKVGRTELMNRFGIKEAAATRDFATYKQIAQENLELDHVEKVYCKTGKFKPKFIDELDSKVLLRALVHGMGDDFAVSATPLVPCELPIRLSPTKLDKLAAISRAVFAKGIVRIGYMSSSGDEKEREIVPFSFAGNGLRWHVRAFDRLKRRFADFVINRIVSVDEVAGDLHEEEQKEHDDQWNRIVRLEIEPHPSCETKRMVEYEYEMSEGCLEVKVRAALAGYVLRLWNVDCSRDYSLKGPQYHLCLSNRESLYDVQNAAIAPGYLP